MHRVILALYLLAYALLHSLLAVDRVKKSLRPVLPTRYYRIAYSLLSVLLLLPIPFLPWPEGMVYRIGAPAAYFFHLLQAGSFVGFLWTLRHTSLGAFLGWDQLRNRPAGEALITSGPYGLCRHPLYFFSSCAFIFHPSVSRAHLVFTLWILLYFYVGAGLEERRLRAQFGPAYETYQATTPRFIPFT